MRVRIQRWGNSLALRIPESFAAEADLREKSEVDLALVDGKFVISPIRSLEQLLGGVTPENVHGEVESGPAVGAEEW